MKLIIGLGNPGKEYEDTRHNIGFMVVDKLAKELGTTEEKWNEEKKFNALTCSVGGVLLVKPQTYMNVTGEAVAKLMKFYKCTAEDLWIIHDDIDLPLGKIRIREQGASAGHNGVESIIEHAKTDEFVRFRLGIGRGKEDKTKHTDRNMGHQNVIHFVLSRFTQHEAGDLRKLVKHGTEAVRVALTQGLDKAMNRFN